MIPLRAVQAVFAIIVLGLTAYGKQEKKFLVNKMSNLSLMMRTVASGASPASDNFLVFTSVWTLLALIYLAVVPTFVPKASHKFAILAVEALTTLFWFAGFIALAVFLGDRVCHGHVCAAAKAATVFAAFTW